MIKALRVVLKSFLHDLQKAPGGSKTSWNLGWIASLFLMFNYVFLEISLIEVEENCVLRGSCCHFCLTLRSPSLLFVVNVHFLQIISNGSTSTANHFYSSLSSSFDISCIVSFSSLKSGEEFTEDRERWNEFYKG